MIESLRDRMEDVYSVVLVANTPAYLYDNLREVLSGMAKRVRLPELTSELRNEMAAPPQPRIRSIVLYLRAVCSDDV